MTRTTLVLATITLALIVICFIGCGHDHHGSMAQSDHHGAYGGDGMSSAGGNVAPALLAVYPADGAIDHPHHLLREPE